jgi:hypothetical protein
MIAGTTGVAAAENVTVATTTQVPVETAQTRADAARARADTLARQGGWAYKSGAHDRAKAEAYSSQAEADTVYWEATQSPPPEWLVDENAVPPPANWGKPVERTWRGYR